MSPHRRVFRRKMSVGERRPQRSTRFRQLLPGRFSFSFNAGVYVGDIICRTLFPPTVCRKRIRHHAIHTPIVLVRVQIACCESREKKSSGLNPAAGVEDSTNCWHFDCKSNGTRLEGLPTDISLLGPGAERRHTATACFRALYNLSYT